MQIRAASLENSCNKWSTQAKYLARVPVHDLNQFAARSKYSRLKILKWELKGHFITTFGQRVSPVNNLNAAGCHAYHIYSYNACQSFHNNLG